ncbi:hypothetical protein [Bdellovibrio sp. HCB337]|uniref:hypothetical protein n=1 Tax=Bdellovibrio sp. HCB337 TaxID=3394358 RepID=UPI0039A5995E
MGFEKLVNFAVTVVLAVALTGNLEKFTWQVQLATLKILKASQTTSWGTPSFLASERK